MPSSTQITKVSDIPLDLVDYYKDSASSAHALLERAVFEAGDNFHELNTNLKAVNAYIKARGSIGELMESSQAHSGGGVSDWDPFANTSCLDGELDVVEAKAEFTAITSGESAAISLYQAGLTYKEISGNTGMSVSKVRNVVKKQGIQRTRKKSVKVL